MLAWGNFITVAINFVIIAWVLFLVVKAMNRMQREGRMPRPAPPTSPRKSRPT